MRALLLRADDGGCGFYRMLEPARVAKSLGVDVKCDTTLPIVGYTNPNGTIEIEELTADVDLVVFQRPLLRALCDVIEYLQVRGIACAVELDDDLSTVHPHSGAWANVQPHISSFSNYKWVLKAASMADLVIASTPAIARKYAPHGRSVVVRNCLPKSVFNIKKEFPEQLRVGWSGSVGTHPYDLDVAGTQIGTFLHVNDTPLSVVGDGEWVREKLYVRDTTEVNVTGWVPLEDYMQTVAENIDVGLVPLELTQFNEAKSYLKGLEMAALGIPFIASPTSEYQYFADTFGGRIAKKPRDWAKHLKSLLSDRDTLLAESAELRESVREQTYEKQIHQWIDAWDLAITMKQKKSVVQ